MRESILCAGAMLLTFAAWAAEPVPVRVLDGPEVQPMRDGLNRVGCRFVDLKSLDDGSLAGCRVLVICGTRPPFEEAVKPLIARWVEAGGSVLAVGGGATRLIDLRLFDAQGYYMTGTTTHNTALDGYHRLIFGYPGANPPAGGTTAGVSHLLRATQGPLMTLGPKATSILTAGGGYSLAAVQRLGAGRLLALGADPQGGQLFSDVNSWSRVSGAKIGTDRLLANAIAFLLDPRCNLIPNSGFEELTDQGSDQSHWEVTVRKGARHEWCKTGAAAGHVCLKLVGAGGGASAEARPLRPIVVERGQTYTFACQYKSTTAWKLSWQWWKGPEGDAKAEPGPAMPVPPSPEWTRFETKLNVPAAVPYARPALQLAGQGEVYIDDVTLKLD